ncbi:MAG: hypothetical protein ACTSX9_09925 [Candidatus Njordarchaeales archaeon]
MSLFSKIRTVGIDLGTSSIKISAGTKRLKFPSMIGEPNPGFRGITTDKSWENNLVIELENGEEYYVGELARLQSMVKIPLAREGRMKSARDALIAVKAALGLIAERPEETFVIATGVPVATGQGEMEALSKSIVGTHEIRIKNDATGDKKIIKAKIVAAPVMPEPYGSWYYVLKRRGERTAIDSVIIDIGYGSTDILTIYNGTILRTASGSIVEAVDTIVTKLAQYLNEKTGRMIKPELLIASLEKGNMVVNIGGASYDISPQVNALSEYVARVIMDELSRLMDSLPPDALIKYFILVGGGVYFLGPKLKEALLSSGFVKSPDQIIIPDDPVMSNAMGFELVAQYYAQRLLGK